MQAYIDKAIDMIKSFKRVTLTLILRIENAKADTLAKIASSLRGKVIVSILIEVLNQKRTGQFAIEQKSINITYEILT